MAIIDVLFGKHKTLSQLTAGELRKEEILLGRQREKLFGRNTQISSEKQKIFQQGASQKNPELRKTLAMDFELKTQEQLMVVRELNLRAKELLTVSRLRMIKENQGRGRALGRLNLTDGDFQRIGGWIEDDAVTQELYTERLDELLNLGREADKAALEGAGLSAAGKELIDIWDQMDRGDVKTDGAFEQADQVVRKRAEKEI